MSLRVQHAWQMQAAKNQLSELVDRATAEGPQGITRHGEPVAVLLSERDFQRLVGPAPESFVSFLINAPKRDSGFPERRVDDEPREDVRF